jgi:hypothetical protein
MRALHMVDQMLPRRGATLELPLEFTGKDEAANFGGLLIILKLIAFELTRCWSQ